MNQNSQLENYIILKPISERFNRISQSITDEEIKSLIKDELRNQIKNIDFDFKYDLQDLLSKYLEENECNILRFVEESLKNKFK